jgi:hypothetical protein
MDHKMLWGTRAPTVDRPSTLRDERAQLGSFGILVSRSFWRRVGGCANLGFPWVRWVRWVHKRMDFIANEDFLGLERKIGVARWEGASGAWEARRVSEMGLGSFGTRGVPGPAWLRAPNEVS